MSFLLSHFTPAHSYRSTRKLPTSILNSKALQKHYKSCQNQKYCHFRGIFTKEDFYWGSETIVSRNYHSGTSGTVHWLCTLPYLPHCLFKSKERRRTNIASLLPKINYSWTEVRKQNSTESIAFLLCNSYFWKRPSSD